MINYQGVDDIILETLSNNASEIARIYLEKYPEILNEYDADTVRRKISWYLEYKKNPATPYKTSPETMVLLVSDIHFGRKTYFFENPDVLDYTPEKAKERIEEITKGVKKINNVISHSYDIDSLYIFLLGDIIDGELTFPAQQVNIELPEFKQITQAADVFGDIIDDLSSIFPKIYIRGVAGNHSHNPQMHNINKGDNILYEMLKREYKRSSKVDFNYSVNFYDICKIKNTSFLLYHGYSIRNYLQIPYYGIYNWGVRRIKAFKENWDILAMGHFHTFSILSYPGFICFLNGTLLSSDEYSFHNFGKDGDRMFHLFGVHPERGITFRYALYSD